MSKTPTRLYTVKHTASGKTRLVEATNPNPALSHVARDEYKVEVADAKEAALLAAAGVRIETAGVNATEPSADTPTHRPAGELNFTDERLRLYHEAVSAVRRQGHVSISFVQSALDINYNLAAVLIQRMEAEGVVSAEDKYGVRTLLPAAA